MPIVNGTTYHESTPSVVIDLLEAFRGRRDARLRIHWGNPETGEDWGGCYDVTGYVGRSMGSVKVPLLLNNRRSSGGGAILDDAIVKIALARGGRVLYQHPAYHAKDA